MLEELKETVCRANRRLVDKHLVVRTFGNVSGIDRESGSVVIKPSGVDYDSLQPADMVVVSVSTGERIEGDLAPSSDTPTHLVLYRAFERIGGIVHTHSLHATAWAQARREIPVLGTTHADYFHGPIPCTRTMKPEEIREDYEANTAKVIVERFEDLDPTEMQAVLVAQHGPFVWAQTPPDAVANAAILEHLALLAGETVALTDKITGISTELLDKHYFRKHGDDAYYGQK